MKILQLFHKMPYPLRDGGAVSLYYSALGLVSQGHCVTVLAVDTPKIQVDTNNIPSEFTAKVHFECSRVDTRVKPFRAFLNLFTANSYFVERFYSETFKADLIRLLSRETFDIIQLEHIYMCVYLDTLRTLSKAKVILRPQNVEHKIWNYIIEHQHNPLEKCFLRIANKRLYQFECQSAKRVDGIIAISAEDARTFRSYSPETAVTSVPLGLDLSQLIKYNTDLQFDTFPVFYHLGSMDWLPNREGMLWFIEEILPFIRKEYPGFQFRIAGKKMPGHFYSRQDENLRVDGEVEDSLAYQQDKAIMLVPLLSGGGIRAKIIEGMGLGKTIISTTIGAEGIPYTKDVNLLIADTKDDFICQILRCRDSIEFCKEIGRNARQLALEHFDFTLTAKKMTDFYTEVIQTVRK